MTITRTDTGIQLSNNELPQIANFDALFAEAKLREAAGSRPSSLKHWWKATELTGATTLVDIVGGANIPVTGVVSSSGIITSIDDFTDAALAAPLENIGSRTFMLSARDGGSLLSNISLGSSAGEYIRLGGSSIGGTQIVGSLATTSTTGMDGTSIGFSLANLGANVGTFKDGILLGPLSANISGTVAPGAFATLTFLSTFAGLAFFVFEGRIPSDFTIASHFMAEAWIKGTKVLFPTDDPDWGTWA